MNILIWITYSSTDWTESGIIANVWRQCVEICDLLKEMAELKGEIILASSANSNVYEVRRVRWMKEGREDSVMFRRFSGYTEHHSITYFTVAPYCSLVICTGKREVCLWILHNGVQSNQQIINSIVCLACLNNSQRSNGLHVFILFYIGLVKCIIFNTHVIISQCQTKTESHEVEYRTI